MQFYTFLFILIFFYEKFEKNHHFKAKTSMFWMKYTCNKISNRFADFLGFKTANCYLFFLNKNRPENQNERKRKIAFTFYVMFTLLLKNNAINFS